MRRIASSPPIPGNVRSMTTTSGASSANSRHASSPLSASADDLDLRRVLQQQPIAGAHDGVIVDEQHAHAIAAFMPRTSGSRRQLDRDAHALGRSRVDLERTAAAPRCARACRASPSPAA